MADLPPLHKEILGLLIKVISALESKRPYALGHSQRVAELSRALGEQIGVSASEANQLYLAGLLHDIGYLVLPDEILHSTEPLTNDQREIVDSQLRVGLQILGTLSLLSGVREIIRYHNNRYDGLGTPHDPHKEDLPLGSRILNVAHVFEALSSDRPFRKRLTNQRALQEMKANEGRFDPNVLNALMEIMLLDVDDKQPQTVELDHFTDWLDKIFGEALKGRFLVPTVPQAMEAIRRLMQDDVTSLKRFAKIVELEPSLALKVIATANSSLYYGMPPVNTVSDALVRIGLNEARNLMITYVYKTLFRTDQIALHQILQTWWERSLLRAAACRSLAEHLGLENHNYAYIVGLLSNIGMPALLQVFISQKEGRPRSEWQMETLFTKIEEWSPKIGAELLRSAHLPMAFSEAVRRKQDNNLLKRNREALLLVLSHEVLNHVLCETGQPDSRLEELIAEHDLDIESKDIAKAFNATVRRYQALQGLLATAEADQIDSKVVLLDTEDILSQ
jgi:HD-like signal output (HDOD) protein